VPQPPPPPVASSHATTEDSTADSGKPDWIQPRLRLKAGLNAKN
jgi:hypothetical protein